MTRPSLATLLCTVVCAALASSCATQGLERKPSASNEKSKQTVAKKKKRKKSTVAKREMQKEMNELRSKNLLRDRLGESFDSKPLKGPITLERLAEIVLEESNSRQLLAETSSPEEHEESEVSSNESETLKPSHASLSSVIASNLSEGKARPSVLNGMLQEKGLQIIPKEDVTKAGDVKIEAKRSLAQASDPVKSSETAAAQTSSFNAPQPYASTVSTHEPGVGLKESAVPLKTLTSLQSSKMQIAHASDSPVIFDIPVTYNERVSQWIKYFQTEGRKSFRLWLERSGRYLPFMQDELERAGLPLDLVYVAMIESGFRPDAVSHASAMGLWQFIASTGRRYGLGIDWWVDERRDFEKSTRAAIAYMKDLNEQFDSWYLVAASYNMGENGVRRLMKKHGTNNFWDLADKGALPRETTDYVPKILAALLISKAPALYGFRDLNYHMPLSYDTVRVPGGTDLVNLADYLGVSEKHLQELNPELLKGFIPRDVRGHNIRVPKGATMLVSQYIRMLGQGAPFAKGPARDSTN